MRGSVSFGAVPGGSVLDGQRAGRTAAGCGVVSGVVGVEVAGGSDSAEVAGVGGDEKSAAADGAFDDAGIGDAGGPGAADEGACGAGAGVVECLDVASGQEQGQAWAMTGAGTTGTSRRSRRARVEGTGASLAALGDD